MFQRLSRTSIPTIEANMGLKCWMLRAEEGNWIMLLLHQKKAHIMDERSWAGKEGLGWKTVHHFGKIQGLWFCFKLGNAL